jgi:phosphoribosylformylglycinamidine (FGAM) synthase-like enzyme
VAVGADPDQIGGVDNFCWPSIQYDPERNPDGRFKAAQLVRACRALRDICLAYEVPLLSGKDSMYVDGHLPGAFGETHKVSAPETLQFSASAVVNDISVCVTMDAKVAGDHVYVVGNTADERGGSAYYSLLGYTGCQVPRVDAAAFMKRYRLMNRAIDQGLTASVHGVYSGGLAVHLAMVAMAGGLGITMDLASLPVADDLDEQVLLFSESAGRFIVTVAPDRSEAFERLFAGQPCRCVGRVTEEAVLHIRTKDGRSIVNRPVAELKTAWQKPFKDL